MRLIIKDKEGNRVNSQVLDIDIAKLWNKELTKQYANPTSEFTNPGKLSGIELVKAKVRHKLNERNNWYDFIKHITDKFPEGQIEYEDLINNMFTPIKREDGSFIINSESQMICNKPYIDILEMWYEKGYTIHNIL